MRYRFTQSARRTQSFFFFLFKNEVYTEGSYFEVSHRAHREHRVFFKRGPLSIKPIFEKKTYVSYVTMCCKKQKPLCPLCALCKKKEKTLCPLCPPCETKEKTLCPPCPLCETKNHSLWYFSPRIIVKARYNCSTKNRRII
jgi:hypothetical protein